MRVYHTLQPDIEQALPRQLGVNISALVVQTSLQLTVSVGKLLHHHTLRLCLAAYRYRTDANVVDPVLCVFRNAMLAVCETERARTSATSYRQQYDLTLHRIKVRINSVEYQSHEQASY